jgi:hypothetical protein
MPMPTPEQPPDSYWDLVAAVAELQAELGKDLVAWSQAYAAAGRASARAANTLRLTADLGRRMERYVESGMPTAALRTFEAIMRPLQTLMMPPGTGTARPYPFSPMPGFWSPGPRDEGASDSG